LRRLTWKGVHFSWGKDEEEEYQAIKESISNLKILSCFDPRRKTYLYCDASRRGLGYILYQIDDEGRYYVISCGSSGLSKAQSNYSIIELELLACVWALEKCRFYLHGIDNVEVMTDHRPLIDLGNKNITEVTNNRLVRLLERTMEFNITWKYIRGEKNVVADMLSRSELATKEAPEFPRNIRMSVRRVQVTRRCVVTWRSWPCWLRKIRDTGRWWRRSWKRRLSRTSLSITR
jgi:ribonuclease HI